MVDKTTVGTAVGLIIALFLSIIIGVTIYHTVGNISSISQQWSGNTSVLADPDYANFTLSLTDYPHSATETRVYWWNETGQTWNNLAAGTNGTATHRWTLNSDRTIWFNVTHNETGESVIGMKGVNVSYNSSGAVSKRDDVNPMSATIFALLPIVGLVIVAAVILTVVLGLGYKRGRGL